jgi:hypothetical protein
MNQQWNGPPPGGGQYQQRPFQQSGRPQAQGQYQRPNVQRDPFSGTADAQGNAGGVKIAPGSHLLELVNSKLTFSQQQNTDMFIPEFRVLQSTAHAPEMIVSYVFNFRHASTKINLKAYTAAIYNITVDDIPPGPEGDAMTRRLATEQFGRGVILWVDATEIQTNSGYPYVKPVFRFYAPPGTVLQPGIIQGAIQAPPQPQGQGQGQGQYQQRQRQRPQPQGQGQYQQRPQPQPQGQGQYQQRPQPQGQGQYQQRPQPQGQGQGYDPNGYDPPPLADDELPF